jgi:hypothetical protein
MMTSQRTNMARNAAGITFSDSANSKSRVCTKLVLIRAARA